MNPDLEKRIALVAADRESGASEILEAGIAILRDAMAAQADVAAVVDADVAAVADADVAAVADALRRAQPSMAPMANLAAAARRGDLDRFERRVTRAPDAIARFASDLLETGVSREAPLHIVTLSYSGTVAHVIETLARRRFVHVSCGEGRPALEGRRLATRLAAAGVPVTLYLDAALGHALDTAQAVLVGADAVTAEWFLNKSGTRMLAAAASHRGVPVYVVAGREKFASAAVAAQLSPREGSASEVWAGQPSGVTIQNPYFEQVPLDLISALVTDIGVVAASDVVRMCQDLDATAQRRDG